MTKPDDIPQDIWNAALQLAEPINDTTILHDMIAEAAARAIMAEREDCIRIAEMNESAYELDGEVSTALGKPR